MKKTFGKKVLVVLVIAMMVPGTFTACSNGSTKKEDPVDYFYSYPNFASDTTMSFHPTGLPAGITYTLTSDTPVKTFTFGVAGFNGTINVSDGPYANFSTVTFSQTFYKDKDGKAIGSQAVKVDILANKFDTLCDDTGVNILSKIPDVKLTY